MRDLREGSWGRCKFLADTVLAFLSLEANCYGSRYLAAGESHLNLGNKDEALRCANRGLELEEICLGNDSPFYQESLQRVNEVEAGRVRAELKGS